MSILINHSAHWQDYQARSGEPPAELQRRFSRRMLEVHPDYAPVSFPPPLFSTPFVQSLAGIALAMTDLIASIPERIFGGDYRAMMAYQGLPSADIDFLLGFCEPRYIELATTFSRPDVLLTRDGFRFVEVNIAPPIGGLGICDRVRSAFAEDGYRDFLRGQGLACDAPRTGQAWHRCIRALARHARAKAVPTFFEATANPDENLAEDFTQPDFEVMIAEDCGFKLVTGPIQALEVSGEGVFYRGERIDIVFTCFTSAECRRFVAPEVLRRLADADRAGVVDFIAPPLNTVFDNKINFEILTSPRFAHHFSAAERKLIERHVPRTFRLEAALLEQAAAGRAGYVLKPASEYGGTGVLIGEATGQAAWEAALRAAHASGDVYIVQEKIQDPYLWQRAPGEAGHSLCLGPMFFGREYGGTLLRHAAFQDSAPIINCAQGACLGTVFTDRPWELAA